MGKSPAVPAVPAVPVATKVLTAETLVLNQDQTNDLLAGFGETAHQQSKRARLLFPLTKWTVDQIIAAMYANADKNNRTILVDTRARSTMIRSHAVAKAWVGAKAGDLVEEDDQDYVLQQLSQVCDINPGQLVKYALVTKDNKPAGWGTVNVVSRVKEGVKGFFAPFGVELTHGSGEKSIFPLVEDYLEHRIEGDPAQALEWLEQYRQGVQYASNEKRRAGAAHNKRAADARKGNGDGSTGKEVKGKSRGARGSYTKGGKGAKGNGKAPVTPDEPAATPTKKVPAKPKTLAELLIDVTKRVVDYDVPVTAAEVKLMDALTEHWELRFRRIPLGGTRKDVKVKKGKRTVKPVTFAPVTPLHPVDEKGNLDVGMLSPEAQMARGQDLKPATMNTILTHMERRGVVTAEKRKAIMAEVHTGRMNQVQFRTRVAKLTAKFDMRQPVSA